VLHEDLQCLHYDIVDMHKLIPMIQEVMKFQRYLIVNQILEKISSGILSCIALFVPLKKILYEINNFYRFAHL
jgi:hypothetical protein